jgi:hypothetical protein
VNDKSFFRYAFELSAAARFGIGSTARRRGFTRSNECAREFSVYLGDEGICIEASAGEKVPDILSLVNASRLNVHLFECKLPTSDKFAIM